MNPITYKNSSGVSQGDITGTAQRQQYWQDLDADTRFWLEEDARYFLHQALSTPVMNVLSRTEGAYIYDYQGNAYLDLHGNGVHNAGFSNPNVLEAVRRQLDEAFAFCPRRYTNIPAIQLAKKLVEQSPEGLSRVLFCPGGSQANEMALMLAKLVTGHWKTISYWGAYHGTGFQSVSIGGDAHFSAGVGPLIPGAFHVEFPNYYRNPWGWTDTEQIDREYLRQLRLVLECNPDIAAIVAEPISATPVIPSRFYWERVQELCRQYGAFLIFDEVIQGLGRSGKLFACEHFVTPDVLVMGKSLGGGVVPFAGILTREEYNVLQNRSIGHYTHEKNPLCAAAGLAELEYIEEHKLVENAEKMGAYLMHRFRDLQDRFPLIGNVAGLGLHIGLDLVRDQRTKEPATTEAERIMFECLKRGMSFKVIEGNVLTFRPALTIDQSIADYIVDTLTEALEVTLGHSSVF